MAMVVVCGRTCCRFDVWPTIYLQSCALPIVRIESGLVWSLQLRFMVQFTITLKIQLSFCSTFAVEWCWSWCHKNRSTIIRSRYYIYGMKALSVHCVVWWTHLLYLLPCCSSAWSNNLLTFRPLINSFSPPARIHLHHHHALGSFVQISLPRFNLLYCFINVLWAKTFGRQQ